MEMVMEGLCLIVFGRFLLRAAAEDLKCRMVRRYLWWISGGAGFVLLFLRRGAEPGALLELACYGILQFCFFSRAYGRADCHAFFCCAVILTAYGGGWETYLWHMLHTFLLLAIVQLCKKNVNARGNLKKPVPLVPYAALGFVISALSLEMAKY